MSSADALDPLTLLKLEHNCSSVTLITDLVSGLSLLASHPRTPHRCLTVRCIPDKMCFLTGHKGLVNAIKYK